MKCAFTTPLWLALVSALGTVSVTSGAHVEVGDLGGRPQPRIIPPPLPRPGNPVAELIHHLVVHPARHYRGLTVFALTTRRVLDSYDYATLDESLRSGWLTISEVGQGSVPQVTVQNTSSRYIFLMAGELITGGKQNRTIADDVMVPPHSGPITIAVRCIEKGRWQGAASGFGSKGGVAAFGIRRQTQSGAGQERVWSEVDERLKALGQSPTGQDLDAAVRSPQVQRVLGEYAEALLPALPRRSVGLVVARGRAIVGTDVFCSARLFSKLRSKVMNAHALDVLGRRFPTIAPPTEDDVRLFLRGAARAHLAYVHTPGAGQLARLSGAVAGSALIMNRSVTHLSLFLPVTGRPAPAPRR